MNQTRIKSVAARIARAKLQEAFTDADASITGTVQLNADGGAWVHCMVFVPPVDIEEATALDATRKP